MQLTYRAILSLLIYLFAVACSEQDTGKPAPYMLSAEQERSIAVFHENTPMPPEGYQYWGVDTFRFKQEIVPVLSKLFAEDRIDELENVAREGMLSLFDLPGVRSRLYLADKSLNREALQGTELHAYTIDTMIAPTLSVEPLGGRLNAEVAYLLGVAYLQGWSSPHISNSFPIIADPEMANHWFKIAALKVAPDYFQALDEQNAGTAIGRYKNHWGKTQVEMIRGMSNEVTGPRTTVPEFQPYLDWLDQMYAAKDLAAFSKVVDELAEMDESALPTFGDALKWLHYMDYGLGDVSAKLKMLRWALTDIRSHLCRRREFTCERLFPRNAEFGLFIDALLSKLPETESTAKCMLENQKYPGIRANMTKHLKIVTDIGREHRALASQYGIETKSTFVNSFAEDATFFGRDHEIAGPIIRGNEEKLVQVKKMFLSDFPDWTLRTLRECFSTTQEPILPETMGTPG